MIKTFTMKHKNVLATAVILSMALAATGCGTSAPTDTASLAAGSVLLSMNPEIEIEYDKDGLVLELEGINDDGRGITTNYKNFSGKPVAEVISDLVEDIHEAGYFDKKVGGREKNIVLKLGEGSQYSDDFLLEMEDAVRQTVGALGLKSAPMTVDKDDLDDKGRINQETAKKLLLHQLHLKSAEFTDYEFELDDGVYELEFTVDGVEYEFEVNAVNGKVLEADVERNDDWKKVPSSAEKVMFHDDDWDDDWDDRYDDDWGDDDDDWDDDDDDWDDDDDDWDDDDDDWDDDDDDDWDDDDDDDDDDDEWDD